MVAIGLTNGALSLAYDGRPLDALTLLHEQQQTWRLPFAPSERAWLVFARGEAREIQGDDLAARDLEEAAALGDSVGNRFVAGIARSTLAMLQRRRGDLTASAATLAGLVEVFSHHGNVTHLTTFLRDSVGTLSRTGELETALVVAEWSLRDTSRPLWGVASSVLQAERDWLVDSLGAEPATAAATRAVDLTITAVADLALEALRRQGVS